MSAGLLGGATTRSPFVGRQKEAEFLLNSIAPVMSGEGPRAVLILAPTGGGKTAFVEHLAPSLESRGAIVVSGKFDQVVRDVPYAAFVEAMRMWLHRAAVLPPSEFEEVGHDLRQRLGTSAPVLTNLLPELALLVGEQQEVPALDIREDRNRFHFAILALLHAMTDGGRTCLIFLDDLQWADAATLELIVQVCAHSRLPRVGFLLTHRTDEGSDLAHTLRALRPLAGDTGLLKQLTLPALSTADIGVMLELIGQSWSGTDAAQVLLAKTGGNPLYVTELLRWESAVRPGSTIGPSVPLKEDVAGLLLRRLRDLPPDQQELLATGAMRGSSIEVATLASVLDREESLVQSQTDRAVRDSMLVREGGGNGLLTYRFRHDQLQKAALDLVPVSRRPLLHARLGQVLGERVVDGDAAVAFDAAFHIHLAGTAGLRDDQRHLAAKVDLVCARRARRAAAERAAYEYASHGYETLGEAAWSSAYDLTLDLHTEAACAAFAVGASEDFRRLSKRVKEHARSFIDELPMQEVLVVALTGSGNVPAAFDLICEGARRFGLSLPSEPDDDDIAATAQRIELALVTMTPEWLEKTARVSDRSIIAQLRLLGLGNAAAYTARPHLLRMLVALELDLSTRHGFSDVTALALAYLGAVDCASLETVPRGVEIRTRALAAATRVSDGAVLARTLDIVHGMTSAWVGPLREAVIPLLDNARLALENGAFDYAGYSALKGCFFALLSGTPLDEVSTRLDTWRDTMGELGQRLAHAYLSRDRQVVELLRRRSASPAVVSGEFSDEANCFRDYDAQDDHYGALYLAVGKLLLAAVFVDPGAAFDAAVRLERHAKGGYGLPHRLFGRFYSAICLWDAVYAGLMQPADAIRAISEILDEITAAAELVPSNFAHKRWLLLALAADLRNEASEALAAFDRAIECACESGYIHEVGLAADRAGRVCARRGRWEKAENHRVRAEEAWMAWGASGRISRPAGAVPTPGEAEAFACATDEPRAIERLMQCVPRWFSARRAWLVRVGKSLEVVATAEGERILCHLERPEPLGSVPCLDPVLVARMATAASAADKRISGACPPGGLCLLPIAFQQRTHGILAIDLQPGRVSADTLAAATFACTHVAAIIDAAQFQASLRQQAHERDRAEEALRKNASLLRDIIDATRAVIYVKEVDGRYVLANRTFTELFGITDADLMEKTDFDIFPRDIAKALRENDLEVLRSRQPLERREDVPVRGEQRTYLSVKVPLVSEQGIPFAVCGVSTDITELSRAEAALRESERRLTLAAVSARLGIWDWDIEHDRMTWDDRMFRLYGYGVRERPTTYGVEIWGNRLHPEDTARAWEECSAALRGEKPYDVEFRVRHPDGMVRHIKADGLVIRGADGTPIRMIGVNRDVTEERQLEEHRRRLTAKVEEEQQWLKAVLDRTPIPLLLTELETGRIAFANRAADAMAGGAFPVGISRGEYTDHFRLTDEHNHDIPVDEWPLIRAVRGEKVEGQMAVLHNSAGRFPVLISAESLRATTDHPPTAVLACQNVSDLVGAIRARDEFLSIASHELKTPLTILKMQIQLRDRALAAGNLQAFVPEALEKMLSSDARQVDRLTRLVNDMLDVARISSGRFELVNNEPVDLVALVNDVLDRTAAALAAAGCKTSMEAPATAFGRWDRGRIEQVVLNLLTNALKYGAGKPIRLMVRALQDRVLFAVRDEGIGIHPIDQERIFQVFERAVSKDEVSGLGLGLYIARRIVEAHGGSLRVESELGAGATFTVELPFEPQAELGAES